MTANEVEILQFLAERSENRYNGRRAYEWKVNFALWAGLGALTGFLLTNEHRPVDSAVPFVLSVSIFGIFCVYTYIWCRGIYKRNCEDQQRAFNYANAMRMKLRTEIPPPLEIYKGEKPHALLSWSHAAQVLTTFLFVVMAITAIWSVRPLNP